MSAPFLAHAGLDITLLLLLGVGGIWVAYRRLRAGGLEEMSRRTAWLLGAMGVAALVLALIVSLTHSDARPAG